jgi:hypothetical protein
MLKDQMSDVNRQLEAMRGLSENWDGYGASAPRAWVIGVAQEFVHFLQAALGRSANGNELHASPTRLGGVLIEWADSASEHEVDINPDGSISFLHCQKSSGEITSRRFSPGDQSVLDPGLLQELRQMIAA